MMQDSRAVRYRRSPDALFRRVGEEILLARPDREDFVALSATAAATWSLLEDPRSLSELVQLLATSYAVPAASIASDVEVLLRDLRLRGWIEHVAEHDA